MEENNELKEPYELFGVECDKGWYHIINPIFDYIEKYNKENPDNKIKVLQVKEKFGCYDKETEVLTSSGWKYFKDVNYEDSIMTLNENNNTIEYHIPNDIVSYKYTGKMYRLSNRGIDLKVTPNHNLYVSKGSYYNWRKNNEKVLYNFELCTPEKYFRKDKRFKKGGAVWKGEEQDTFNIDSTKEPRLFKVGGNKLRTYTIKGFNAKMDDFLRFLGFYVAEGYSDVKRGNISIAYNPYDEEDLIRNLMLNIGVNIKGSPGLKHIYNKKLSKWLVNNCGHLAPNKKVPDFIKNLSPRQIRIFLEYLFIGDGHKDKTSNILTTTSKQLADDVCELLIKCGDCFRVYTPRMRSKNKESKIKSKLIVYEINWLKINDVETDMSKAKETKSYIEQWEDYDDMVYCVTVPNHIIYVRRNGKGCWCGNSLRYYVSHGDETLYKMIDKAENESLKTCESCGSKDNVIHTEGWIWTVCKNCLQKSVKRSYRPVTFWENNKHYKCDKDGIKEV